MDNQKTASRTLESLANDHINAPVKLVRSKASKYNFIKYDEVPPGYYLSEIRAVCNTKNRKGQPTFDVCYEIVDAYKYYAYRHKRINKSELKFYCVKERFPLEGACTDRFISLLCDEYGFNDEINGDDLIGLCEVYSIGYDDDSAIGNITDRKECTPDELVEFWDSRNNYE